MISSERNRLLLLLGRTYPLLQGGGNYAKRDRYRKRAIERKADPFIFHMANIRVKGGKRFLIKGFIFSCQKYF